MVAEVLGYDISANDATTFKFLSVYAQERSDSIVSLNRVVITWEIVFKLGFKNQGSFRQG